MVRVRLLDHEDRPCVVASKERAVVLDRVLEDGRVAIEVGVVRVGEIAAGSERQAEQAAFAVGVGEFGGVEHGGQRSVRQPQDPSTLLDDVQAGVALPPRQVDGCLGDSDLGERSLPGRRLSRRLAPSDDGRPVDAAGAESVGCVGRAVGWCGASWPSPAGRRRSRRHPFRRRRRRCTRRRSRAVRRRRSRPRPASRDPTRARPSCTTLTTSRPSREKMAPPASPRAELVEMARWS